MPQTLQISQFPLELLQEIFLNVCRDANDHTFVQTCKKWTTATSFTPNYRSPASPYSISHVNRQWRNIAINLPQLWTHLRIIKPQTEGISQFAMEWVGRAGSLPLYLSLHYLREASVVTRTILNFYLSSINRCLSFELDFFSPEDLFGIQWPERHHLKFIKMRIQYFDPVKWEVVPNFFLCSDTLLLFIWDGPRLSVKYSQPWANPPELGLLRIGYDIHIWISVLSKFTNIVRLVLSLESTWFSSSQTAEFITMSQLTFLAVESKCNHYGGLFDFLILPSLLELEITADCPVDFTPIVDVLERSGSKLEKLKVEVNRRVMDDFIDAAFARALVQPCFKGLRELEGRNSSWASTMEVLKARMPVEDVETMSALIDTTRETGRTSRSMYRYLPRLAKLSLTECGSGIVYNPEHSLDNSVQQ